MTGKARENWVKTAIESAYSAERGLPRLPRHVFDRLWNLLGDDEVKWIETDLRLDGDRFNGRLTVLTDELIALTELKNVQTPRYYDRSTDDGPVSVRVLARKALVAMSVGPLDDMGSSASYVWKDSSVYESNLWPQYSPGVTLHYADGTEVEVGRYGNGGDFMSLLPSLRGDLTAN